jgi:hypothetical protein
MNLPLEDKKKKIQMCNDIYVFCFCSFFFLIIELRKELLHFLLII